MANIRAVWHSTDKYRCIIWQCNYRFKGDHHCTTPHLYEKDIKDMFLRAFGKLMADRNHILEDMRLVQATLCDCTELNAQQAALAEEMEIVGELIHQYIEGNTIKVQNQEEYMERYGAIKPLTGKGHFLIMPNCDSGCMNVFLSTLSKIYPNDRILLCCDGAAWHKSAKLDIPDNICMFFIPPYTPEMNPIEQIWKEIRLRGFRNQVFPSLNKVV